MTPYEGRNLFPPSNPVPKSTLANVAGGTYEVDIEVPNEYPFKPPKMRFITKVYHPNISSQTVPSPFIFISSHPFLTLCGRDSFVLIF